ncbi:MAG: alpha-ribazole phosphatase [Pseudomonadota bacterium]
MIYLLRHGEIDSEGEKRFIGWTDLPLNEDGVRQARQWRTKLSDTVFERIYCSDLCRTRRTAEIIGEKRGVDIRDTPALREIHLGEFETLRMAEVKDRFPDKWRERGENLFSYRPMGGESFSDLCDRVLPTFDTIAGDAGGNILIVAHAGVNRMILCRVLGMPPEHLFRIGQDYACLNRIDCGAKPYRVTAMNITLDTLS